MMSDAELHCRLGCRLSLQIHSMQSLSSLRRSKSCIEHVIFYRLIFRHYYNT